MSDSTTIEIPALPNLTIHLPNLGLTDEQFLAFCSINKILRIERQATGRIIVKPPTTLTTGSQNAALTYVIGIWNKKSKLGVVFGSSSGFTLPNGAIRSPDVSWMPHERWDSLEKSVQNSFAPICPDFVLELRSGSDSLRELSEKMEEYIANGCRLGWLVDPTKRQTMVYLPDGSVNVVPFDQKFEGGEVLPGFELVMADVIKE